MSKSTKIIDQIKAERLFIHDLATPLMIAHGMTDAVWSKMDANDPLKEKLHKAVNALNKMTNILKDRRSHLIEQTKIMAEET